MLTLYNPVTGAFDASTGSGANTQAGQVDLNILIELRTMNALLLALANGQNGVTLESLRSDVVNAT